MNNGSLPRRRRCHGQGNDQGGTTPSVRINFVGH